MIPVLLMLAQAAAPAAAPAPAPEIWIIDQLRYQAPADPGALQPKLDAAHTMAAVIDVLNEQHIAFQRLNISTDASKFPAEDRARVLALSPGEPFILAQPNFVTVNVLTARRPGNLAPAAPVDPQLAAAAEQLLKEMRSEEQLRAIVQQSIAQMRSGAIMTAQIERNDAMRLQRAKNPQAWDAAVTRIGGLQAAATERVIADLMPELHHQSIVAYSSNFTLAELRELLAFYRTPIGRKMIDRGPAISAATALWFQRAYAERLVPVMNALQPQIQQILAPLTLQTPAR